MAGSGGDTPRHYDCRPRDFRRGGVYPLPKCRRDDTSQTGFKSIECKFVRSPAGSMHRPCRASRIPSLVKEAASAYGDIMRRILRIILGVAFILLGIVGLFLPFLQGILFIAIGLFLLASHLPLIARLICWLQRKVPAVDRLMVRLRQSVHKDWHPPPCPPED
jgi:uncharacterized protein